MANPNLSDSGGRFRPFSSLRWRMVLVFAGVLLLTLTLATGVSGYISLAALYSHAETDREYMEKRLTRFAASVHEEHRGWEPVESAVHSIGPALGKRVIILDDRGMVVADSGRRPDKDRDDDDDWPWAAPARFFNQEVETRAISNDAGDTIGYLLTGDDPPDEPFAPLEVAMVQGNVRKSLFIGGIAAGLLGIVVVGLMATRMLRPLAQLNLAAVRVGRGDLSERVPERGPAEVRRLAAAFNTMAHNLERSDAVRRNMTADVAHELRTPLSNIRGYLEAIRDGVLPADSATIDTLHQQSTHLSQLVDDLALLARAEAGALALDIQRVAPARIVQESVEAFRARAAADGVTLHLEAPDDLPEIAADARRVAQIIDNLVENAITHTPAGGTVGVAIGRAGGGVQVSVADTGPGIAPEELEHVFDRFYRTDPSRSRATGGSGLGLTIARQLAAAHGGRLAAESAVGEGSRFVCTLPVEGPAAGDDGAAG